MSLLALIAALLLEQLHPLSTRKYLSSCLASYVSFFSNHFNAGQHEHGKVAWLLAVFPLITCAVVLYWVLHNIHPILAWALNLVVLYITMGFRQFSHYFTEIQVALRAGELDEARVLLSSWRGTPSHELNAEEVARVSIEQAFISSHQNVFGVIVWFVIFSVFGLGGAAGALLYRLGHYLRWHLNGEVAVGSMAESTEGFNHFAQQMVDVLEWLPVRMTAITFAIVGNFEDTIYCWRTQAESWPESETGVLLSSGAGSLGVRLGMTIPQGGVSIDRPELGTGDAADADYMQSTVGLVWRSLVFWLLLLLMMTLASV